MLSQWSPHEEAISNINEADQTAQLSIPPLVRSSFISGIPQRYLQEEAALQHDLFNWEGMTPTHIGGLSIFEQGDRRLEVIYANRNSLEHTLGVDLIYYNEKYEMFVLVQYKLMREEHNLMLYRPDAQLERELARMDQFYNSSRQTTSIATHNSFRLSDDGFMVKLVPNTGLRPASGELIKGMYIPREYMHFLLGACGPKGPQGGAQITFDNVPRYLTNSQFAASVHDGWIGTRGVQSQALSELIRHFYETGRSLMIAYEKPA